MSSTPQKHPLLATRAFNVRMYLVQFLAELDAAEAEAGEAEKVLYIEARTNLVLAQARCWSAERLLREASETT